MPANDSADHALFEQSLGSFVPPDVFDVHAHLYRRIDATPSLPTDLGDETGNVGWNEYARGVARWLGKRPAPEGLFFTFPKADLEVTGANRFVAEQIRNRPGSRALLMIRPGDDPAAVERSLDADGFVGFKVYHVFARRPDTFAAAIDEFIPPWAWELAHQRGLAIMLHMVRPRALADRLNQDYIRDHCRRYPGARLILAHAARGFCGRHTVEGIASLRGLDNVYFDTSAVCEPTALEAILREFGPRRLMYASDFPVSELHGRCVSIADGFVWLQEPGVDWQRAQPTRVGIEALLALQQACRTLHLTDSDIERIFHANARELLGLATKAGNETQRLYERARQLIPGGTQFLSKRPEMFAPGRWPAYYSEARGVTVTDLDGRRYTDMTTSGIGACLLGYADPDVSAAVQRRVQLGSMCTLNAPEEVTLAELLIELHPWAEQVRYARTGGEALAIAVRIARAATRRDRIAFCGYHGWSDWYLAANLPAPGTDGDALQRHLLPGLAPAGVPRGLSGTALPFQYGQLDALHRIVREAGGTLAAVVMEPTRRIEPPPGFLEGVRQLCDDCGATLIFDEVTAGWRLHLGGVHLRYGVAPDLAVFGKALGNGHPMAALLGRARIMAVAQETFISSTYWSEGVGPVAALAAVRKMQRVDVPAQVTRIGCRLRDGWIALGREHRLPVQVAGHPALLQLGFEHPLNAVLGTLLTVRMLERGFLAGSGFYPSLAHDDGHVDAYLAALDPVFAELAAALRENDVERRLGSPVRHTGFARLT
jgi:glutamate-1-semialdehyde 2,1-aminomutase